MQKFYQNGDFILILKLMESLLRAMKSQGSLFIFLE